VLLIVEFDGYVVCCTHFSLTREDRDLSVPVIVNVVKDIGKPLFLAGDMNAVYDSREQELLREHFKVLNDHKENTIPAVNPQRCIDYIYSYNNGNPLSVLRREVLFDEQAASDHLPLFVDVRLHTAAGKTMEAKPYLQNPANNGTATSRITNVPVRGRVGYGMDFLRDGATRSICCVRHGLRLRRRPDASICLKALYIIYSAQLGIT
jgi:hypothetical protein